MMGIFFASPVKLYEALIELLATKVACRMAEYFEPCSEVMTPPKSWT